MGCQLGGNRQLEFTRDLGTVWLQKKDTALLRVLAPSCPKPKIFCSILPIPMQRNSGFLRLCYIRLTSG